MQSILNPPTPSKTQRLKKSDTKKPHKANDNKKTKTPDKPKPKECAFWDLWCKAQQSLFGSGGGGGIIPGLEAAPKIPLLA